MKSFLNTVRNVLVKDVFELRKILKLKSPLVLAQAVFSELLGRVTLGLEGMSLNFSLLLILSLIMNVMWSTLKSIAWASILNFVLFL